MAQKEISKISIRQTIKYDRDPYDRILKLTKNILLAGYDKKEKSNNKKEHG